PYIVTLFDDESADIRYYAFVTASELMHRDLVASAGARLFDRDAEVSALPMALLWRHRRFGREFQRVLGKVRATARSPRVRRWRRAAPRGRRSSSGRRTTRRTTRAWRGGGRRGRGGGAAPGGGRRARSATGGRAPVVEARCSAAGRRGGGVYAGRAGAAVPEGA